MKLKALLTDDDAVSPVIGVILMVAITVILAAVIGTFVLGLGNQVGNNAPQASFTFDFDDANGQLTIAHNGGASIKATQLDVKADADFTPNDASDGLQTEPFDSAGFSVGTDVTAGDSITITESNADGLNGATVRVIWTSESGDSSAELGKWSGPNA